MTKFRLKHVAQLDTQTLLPHNFSCVESATDLFIHINDTQRDVTHKKWFLSLQMTVVMPPQSTD